MKVSFGTKLLASHVAVALVAGGVAVLVIDRSLSEQLEAQIDRRLEGQARAVSRWVETARHYERLAPRLSGVVGARVTVVDEHGAVVGDSAPDAPGTHTEGDAPEVRVARAEGIGRATRWGHAHAKEVRHVAVLGDNDMVVRLGLPTDEIRATRASVRDRLFLGVTVSLLIAAALAFVIARALSRRLRDASAVAARIGRGIYDVPPADGPADEVGLLSRTLATTAAQLRDIDARRRQFLANVAHELRTPVTSIRGYSETLAGEDVDAETQREFLSVIHRNALRISRLVDELLQLESLQARSAQRPAERVAVAAVVDNVIATSRANAPAGVELVSHVSAEVAVMGDADGVEQILQNLVDNAVRHGGPEVTVEVSAARRSESVVVAVKDDGAGIAPEHLDRVFERFFRAEEGRSRNSGGSGLGLAIARQLAESMGGRLDVDSKPGEGATFRLELPRAG